VIGSSEGADAAVSARTIATRGAACRVQHRAAMDELPTIETDKLALVSGGVGPTTPGRIAALAGRVLGRKTATAAAATTAAAVAAPPQTIGQRVSTWGMNVLVFAGLGELFGVNDKIKKAIGMSNEQLPPLMKLGPEPQLPDLVPLGQ
jgi:hypothetical protein